MKFMKFTIYAGNTNSHGKILGSEKDHLREPTLFSKRDHVQYMYIVLPTQLVTFLNFISLVSNYAKM